MKIVIFTLGSRGDTQPYLALALGLQQAGHRVTLAAPSSFAGWIESCGVAACPLEFNPQEVMESLTRQKNAFQAARAMRQVVETGALEAARQAWQAAQDCDLFLQTGTGGVALELAALRGVPVAFAHLVPAEPTRAFPPFFLPLRRLPGGAANLFSHHLVQQMLWSMMGAGAANRFRADLGLPPWPSLRAMQSYTRSLDAPVLYAFSPSLLPRPADWEAQHHVTGYWFLDPAPGWQPPTDLLRFLENGPPPVGIGFGSMSRTNPARQTALALRALELSGQRGVILTGGGALARTSTPANVFFLDEAPHAWLFPRLAAVVHHGGAGTTAAGLRAGIPALIAAFGGDQVAWADLVVSAGAGPRLPGIQRLTAEALAQAIRTAVTDPALRARAAALGAKIRAEDGVGRALEILERHASFSSQR